VLSFGSQEQHETGDFVTAGSEFAGDCFNGACLF
jgi:hypothetical protein